MRSVMKNTESSRDIPQAEEKKRPVISFKKADTTLKVLENRPVMALPPDDRYTQRKPRPAQSTDTQPRPGAQRMRDDVKPMFQRDITFSTPTKDGTAKKQHKGKK